jgi:hypothetical protein
MSKLAPLEILMILDIFQCFFCFQEVIEAYGKILLFYFSEILLF